MNSHLSTKKILIACVLAFISITIFVIASTTTYYISTSGNDTTGDGSVGNPWQTLYKACETVTTSGDIIHVNAGTYTETLQCDLRVGVSIEGDGVTSILRSSLTADWTEMISLISAEGTNGNQHISNVKLDGQNLATFWGIYVGGRSNVSIHDTTIEDFKDRGVIITGRSDSAEAPPTIYATGNTFYNNIMNNCAAYNTANGVYGRGCLNIGGQDGMLIHDNTITQDQRPEGYNGWPIKYFSDGYLKGVKIYNNVLNKIPFRGAYLGSNGWDFAIELFHIEGLEVYGNTITGGGIDLNYNNPGSYAYSLWIHDNIIKLDALEGSTNSGMTLEYDTIGAIIENNIIDKMSNGILFTPRAGNTITDVTIRKNLFSNENMNTGNGTNAGWINTHGGGTNYNINGFHILNNTFQSSSSNRPWWGIEFGTVNTGTLQNINIKNNIMMGALSGAIVQGGTVIMDNVNISNNDIYDITTTTNPVWEDNTPTNYTYANNLHTNPLFIGSGSYALQMSSPLIDVGLDVGIAYNGSAPDIGYAEYDSGGNSAPAPDAGPNQSITLPTDYVTMAGGATDSDGTIASHVWTKYSGPSTYTITDPNSYTTTITGLIAGTYVFRLTATDDDGATGYDDITITVNASGGITYATLSPTDKSSYVTLSNGDLTATFTRDELDNVRSTISKTSGKWYWESSATSIGGSYLHVGSLSGSSDLLEGYTAGQLDGVAVNVNGDYYVDNSYVGNLGVTITDGVIVGSALDMDSHTYYIYVAGTLRATVTGWYKSGHSYFGAADTWHNPGITTVNFGQSSFTYSPPSGFNSGLYSIANATPLADAGPNQSITLPTDYVTMAGGATDSDGTIASHVWTKYSGPSTYTITDPNSYTTTITGLIAGTYVFRLTATDDQSATNYDDVTITVNPANIPPSANAGSDQSITLPTSTATLNGSASTDSDGTISTYAWSFISGPSTPSITSPSSSSTGITSMTSAGSYVFRLTVTDDDGASHSDDITIVVSSTNIPPSANAGVSQSIVLPTSSSTVSGSGSLDSDGTISTYAWSFISGPSTPSITSPSSVSTNITDMTISGTYTFRLTVTDDDGATDSDDIDIVVSSQPSSSGGRGGGMIISGLSSPCTSCVPIEKINEQPTFPNPGSDGVYNPLVSVTALKLNVRSARNFLSPVVTVIDRNTVVEVLDDNLYNKWIKIRTPDSIEGFIRAKFIEWYFIKPNDKASITTQQLNVRSADSVKSSSLQVLIPTDIVDVISVSAKTIWAKIRTIDGLIGYANKFLLRVLISQ